MCTIGSSVLDKSPRRTKSLPSKENQTILPTLPSLRISMDHIRTSDSPRSTTSPSITVDISTSAEALDLTSTTPLTITLTLTLNHDMPVTFRRTDSDLFYLPLYRHGLTFTNTTTRRLVNRSKINVCFSSRSDLLPTEGNAAEWTTLYPDQPHVLEISFKPNGREKKWPRVAGFVEGGIYEIGVTDQAGIIGWIEGSLEEILAMRTAGSIPKQRFDFRVDFHVRETKTFQVKGPDLDGSLEGRMAARKKRELMERDGGDDGTR